MDSSLCPICGLFLENAQHLFFGCDLARSIALRICHWWNINWTKISSFAEWNSWSIFDDSPRSVHCCSTILFRSPLIGIGYNCGYLFKRRKVLVVPGMPKLYLSRNVSVVDYERYTENNKPYFKIIRADGTHQIFLSFLSLLRNFDREDLEVLWQLVKEGFASSKPKNFSDDFLLTTLTYVFEKPDFEAQVWKNQRSVYGLAKVKSWRLLQSCGVHIITLTTT
uniref:RNA-directed DNA polymerase, eukaryota n=1 Tax=Tanacetum cinerariifolium TaxID=118510 RepID=A0A6L2JBD8_TANCI|nr:RNA-directed DNA polymerase, eukaryota [Tanacetum cinerariifolium]